MVAHPATVAKHDAGITGLELLHPRPERTGVGHHASEHEAEQEAPAGERCEATPCVAEAAAGRREGAWH